MKFKFETLSSYAATQVEWHYIGNLIVSYYASIISKLYARLAMYTETFSKIKFFFCCIRSGSDEMFTYNIKAAVIKFNFIDDAISMNYQLFNSF